MACEMISNIASVSDFLVWPTACHYYFYLWIILAISLIVIVSMYKKDKEVNNQADIIPCLGVGSIVAVMLALSGTLIKNSESIPMVQDGVLLIILAIFIPIIIIWFLKS